MDRDNFTVNDPLNHSDYLSAVAIYIFLANRGSKTFHGSLLNFILPQKLFTRAWPLLRRQTFSIDETTKEI
jgi:hypothetical protein